MDGDSMKKANQGELSLITLTQYCMFKICSWLKKKVKKVIKFLEEWKKVWNVCSPESSSKPGNDEYKSYGCSG